VAIWRRRRFESAGVTEYPAGPNLASLATIGRQKIYVTRPGYDDIGMILADMAVTFEPFTGEYDCDLLFLNCGTPDTMDPARLRGLVEGGGCLYASDLTSSLMMEAFPGLFRFEGSGSSGQVPAEVVDHELRDVIGAEVDVEFDMGSWSILAGCRGDTLVRGAPGTPYSGKPLMVEVDVGRGAVFYTSFHNKAQASAKETVLLKLLVLKQIGASSHKTLIQVGQSLGISLVTLRKTAD
jgi:hypothetical protein